MVTAAFGIYSWGGVRWSNGSSSGLWLFYTFEQVLSNVIRKHVKNVGTVTTSNTFQKQIRHILTKTSLMSSLQTLSLALRQPISLSHYRGGGGGGGVTPLSGHIGILTSCGEVFGRHSGNGIYIC